MNLGLECFITQDTKKKEDVFDSQQFMIDFINHQHAGEVLNGTFYKLVDIYNHISKFGITEENKALFASSFESIGLTYSLESVIDSIRLVIAKIKEWIKKSIEYIKMFIAKLLPNNKEKIQAIQKRIKEIEQEYKEKRIEIKAGKFGYKVVNLKVLDKVESLMQAHTKMVIQYDLPGGTDEEFKSDVEYMKELIEDVRSNSTKMHKNPEATFFISTEGTYPTAFNLVIDNSLSASDTLVKMASTAKKHIEQLDQELEYVERTIKEKGEEATLGYLLIKQSKMDLLKAKQTFLGVIVTFAAEAQNDVVKNAKTMNGFMNRLIEQYGK